MATGSRVRKFHTDFTFIFSDTKLIIKYMYIGPLLWKIT